MKFYIVVINGLDLIITGPFDFEELAMEKRAAIAVFEHKHVVRCTRYVENSPEFCSWENFVNEWMK